MNTTENGLAADVSTKTTNAPSVVQRVLWTGSLVAIGSVLAFHAALAYSPDLARYVPELGITSSSNSASTCHATPSAGACCRARPIVAADFAGCCLMDSPERPCLTDGLYSENDSDAFAEAPADAIECLPQTAPESAAPADASDPA